MTIARYVTVAALVANLALIVPNAWTLHRTRMILARLQEATAATAEQDCDQPYPATAPYHDGMTLCPGQSAIIQVPLMPLTDGEPPSRGGAR